jgi:predicted nucleotidyltransferase component of viral defense system
MITKQDLQRIASKRKVKDLAFMEKDYALTWALKAIYSNPALSETLVFKGGTCISKIYAENYRLSEDLDFSIYKNKQLSLETLVSELKKSFEQVKTEGAPELSVKDYEQLSNQGYMSVKVRYVGPLAHPCEIKLEVSLKEHVIYASEHLPLKDKTYEEIGDFKIHCYGI